MRQIRTGTQDFSRMTDKSLIRQSQRRTAALFLVNTMSLRNMNIAPRAFLGFALIGGLMLVLGVFALNQMSKIRGAGENIVESSVPSIKALDEFTQLTLRLRVRRKASGCHQQGPDVSAHFLQTPDS